MIAMIAPGHNSCEHTLNTLRYADRVKELMPRKLEDAGNAPAADDDDDDEVGDEVGDIPLGGSLAKKDLQRLHQRQGERKR
jgi:kinesin family protein 2/24